MSDVRPNTPSVADRTQPVATGGSAIAAHFLGDTAAFVLSEEAAMLVKADGTSQRVPLHDGGILSSTSDGARIVTGGDDGKVAEVDRDGTLRTVVADPKKRWIDQVALGPDGAVAWSTGKTVQTINRKGEVRSLDLPSTAGGLAFLPKGFRLAIAHYNGASLWFPNAQAKPESLEWKGSHLGVTVSPDGRFLVTTMQEPMLHGWRLVDSKHMRMSGYATRVRSMSWTADGAFLATGGSDQLILWPFSSKDGPMGKQPTILAPHAKRLAVVACHPKQPVVAAGYEDGLVLLVRLDDGAEVLVHSSDLDTPVTALAWSADGLRLAFACEDRTAGVVDLA
ncbi:WD40 repeat domain-containing protein [Pseudorhodoplanes sp.]|uniref:WD40 repeat domain-containing protein n=1 Tax=Pseudorhodoplanes sp. TaxID=1934341 RepID=UPI002BDFA888|nr:WD40 repeat domain-containing protein [Pseudorhodoplanes sp.]HWV54338.1 WD40 repeat domain-containing protein [Pseudorhodoplanes sp.]